MSVIRRRWRFTGEVQGVGFRYYARAAAQHLDLTGWVANNWDGSVTLEAPRSSARTAGPASRALKSPTCPPRTASTALLCAAESEI